MGTKKDRIPRIIDDKLSSFIEFNEIPSNLHGDDSEPISIPTTAFELNGYSGSNRGT